MKPSLPILNTVNKTNAISWTAEQIKILRIWADKTWALAWMHNKASINYNQLNMKLYIPTIILNTLCGVGNFAILNTTDTPTRISVIFIISSINICLAMVICSTLFLKYGEKSAAHFRAYLNYSSFYRNINLELSLHPRSRGNCIEFSNNCREDYDKLVNISPSIPNYIINDYMTTFPDYINKPDIANSMADVIIAITPKEDEKNSNSSSIDGNSKSSRNKELDIWRSLELHQRTPTFNIPSNIVSLKRTLQEHLEQNLTSNLLRIHQNGTSNI